MTRLAALAQHWPMLISALLCSALITTTAIEKVELPEWVFTAFERATPTPAQPTPVVPLPDIDVPYAPAPGRDDRTPVPYHSHVFGLNDPHLPAKLTGVGPVFWEHAGHGSGALIAPNIVLTTAHLFTERGKWDGPFGPTDKPPAPSDGQIYLEACKTAYPFTAIHLGSIAPRKSLGLDYAIVELATPACAEAMVLPVAETPRDLYGAEGQILLNMGAYRFRELQRFAEHALFADQRSDSSRFARYSVFGVRCRATAHKDTGDVAEGSTGLVITSGCDGVPGGSGGPLIVSRDGGATYSIVGVANSYRKTDAEYNNYTAIEGAFAAHLSQFVGVTTLPDATATSMPSSSLHPDLTDHGPWEAMRRDPTLEDMQ